MDPKEFIEKCNELGLNPSKIEEHRARVVSDEENTYEIVDTCRLDNGKVLSLGSGSNPVLSVEGVVPFVPAAGASSRYFKLFNKLRAAMEAADFELIVEESAKLRQQGCLNWALPKLLHDYIEAPNENANLEDILALFSLPKALQLTKLGGENFLQAKINEHKSLELNLGHVFITPPGRKQEFSKELSKGEMPFELFEQGVDQSTIRLKPNGDPYLDGQGKLSLVPAGHGTLSPFIFETGSKFKGAHSVFIRNIDNVSGCSSDVVDATKNFLGQHCFLLEHLNEIRESLKQGNEEYAKKFATKIVKHFDVETHEDVLWDLQTNLFHYSPTVEKTSQELLRLYERPLNSFGQVSNLGNEVGGGPVFINTKLGVVKICLELPHVSDEDKENIFKDPKKATHFNPVFVASEIPQSPDYYEHTPQPFWILAHKNFKDEEVCYHESVLYEVIGNSIQSNLVFFEIPRILFNPHKSIEG